MLSKLIAFLLLSVAVASAQQAQRQNKQDTRNINMQQRSGFGVNAGYGNDGFAASAHVGNPLNHNFLFPVIVGLGLLSLFNIILTIIGPLLKKKEEAASSGSTAKEAERSARNIIDLATTVMQAMQDGYDNYEE